jgi:hypothetical protein
LMYYSVVHFSPVVYENEVANAIPLFI